VLNLQTGRAHSPLPVNDATFGYTYPVIQYPHNPALGYGDAIAGAFVYRGNRLPQLQGKLIFGDITTGLLFYADLAAVTAADDGNPATLSAFQRIEFLWDNPRNPAGRERFDRMYEIVADTYRARGGPLDRLPGAATVSDLTGGGRADIRLAVDNAGELYVLSKSDGMIRALVATVSPANVPAITRAPLAQSIATGGSAVFTVEAQDAAAYQWKHDGVTIPGATGALFTVLNATVAHGGSYTVDVANAAGTSTSAAAVLTVTPTTAPGRMVNFSIRSNAGTGSQTLIVGLALDAAPGLAAPTLLLRGIGPTLASFGVLDALADPKIDLFRGQTRLAENDNWDALSGAAGLALQVGAFALTPQSKDAALVQSGLTAGAYTVQITAATPSGVTSAGGVALAEVFDASSPGAPVRQMVNVSARTQVGTGEEILIAGFTIGGTTARTVLIRAAGPVLSTFQVTGTLSDPRLTLFHGTTAIAESDNWQSSPELVNIFSATGAFPFNARSRDAALLITLPPGSYTAHVSGVGAGNTATGVALIEVYALP
jgi:hypothetical protein